MHVLQPQRTRQQFTTEFLASPLKDLEKEDLALIGGIVIAVYQLKAGMAPCLLLVGMLLMLTRRLAISQVIGFLVLENGIFLYALTQTRGMSLMVEMGVVLDVLVGVMIAGLVIYPALYSLSLATLNKSMQRFVGFGNFEFLFKRETFWMVVQQSCIFAVTAVIFKALIGFVVAHFVANVPANKQCRCGRRVQ